MVRSRTNLNMQVGRPCLELSAGLLVLVKPAGREPGPRGVKGQRSGRSILSPGRFMEERWLVSKDFIEI